MAEGLLRELLDQRGIDATIGSTGRIAPGSPASKYAVSVLRARGIDISEHRSRVLDVEQLDAADLVLCMAREHVREAVLLDARAFTRVFTLKELVRRGQLIGPRLAHESPAKYLSRAGLGRRPSDQLGADDRDDIADPVGQSRERYEATVDEIEGLVTVLVDLLWPGSAAESTG
jgi:protein-tyrosine-phosphatase